MKCSVAGIVCCDCGTCPVLSAEARRRNQVRRSVNPVLSQLRKEQVGELVTVVLKNKKAHYQSRKAANKGEEQRVLVYYWTRDETRSTISRDPRSVPAQHVQNYSTSDQLCTLRRMASSCDCLNPPLRTNSRFHSPQRHTTSGARQHLVTPGWDNPIPDTVFTNTAAPACIVHDAFQSSPTTFSNPHFLCAS